MKSYKSVTALLAVLVAAVFFVPHLAHAAGDSMPDQSQCDSGSPDFTWNDLGLDRPVIASMTVDGQVVPDPTNPDVGEVGAVVCAAQDEGRFVGVTLYRHDGLNDDHQDLTGAMAPDGVTPITDETQFHLVLTDMGELDEFYTFSLIHGVVLDWATAGLGTDAASVDVTLTPARTPLGTGSDFDFCTATPPHCNATKSDMDVLSGSLYMLFDQDGYGEDVAGSYFALVSAMGGFVTPEQTPEGPTDLVASLGAPHFLADGTTPNVGSMQAFLPTAVVAGFFGLLPDEIDTSSLSVVRTETGSTISTVPFNAQEVSGGVEINVDNITFSSPDYRLHAVLDTDLVRLSGANRVATSIAIDQDAFPTANSADAIVVATSADFPDGLGAGPLAGLLDAPLLINPKDSLDSSVAAEITRVFDSVDDTHSVTDLYLIGGTSALSSDVETAIAALDPDLDIKRIGGNNRIETAIKVAAEMDTIRGNGPSEAILANARNFPDALAASAAASAETVNPDFMPILLSDSKALDAGVSSYFDSVAGTLDTVDLVGGTVVLSDAVMVAADMDVDTVNRYAGNNRFETAVAIADAFFSGANTPRTIGIANGLGFADALTGGRHSGLNNRPLLLVTPTSLPTPTSDYLTVNAAPIAEGNVYGGTVVVPDSIKQAVEAVYFQ
ncbi:MAG: cell wall-binding repeat-containing protein [Candidatus Andersenbacteria bacterium]